MLKLRNLHKRLGNVHALAGISADLKAGAVTGLVGRNGAGKSTLLRCIAGHLAADTGEMLLDETIYAPTSAAAARKLGCYFVNQELSFFRCLTVQENWDLLSPAPSPLADDWRMLAGRSAATLSPSQVQRLILDATTRFPARILLLDEPTALLNDDEASSFLGQLRARLSKETITILATHRPGDFDQVDDWLFLDEGEVALRTSNASQAMSFFLSPESHRAAKQRDAHQLQSDRRRRPRGSDSASRIVGYTAASGGPLYSEARRMLGFRIPLGFLGPERQADHVLPQLTVGDHVRLALSNDATALAAILATLGLPLTPALARRPIGTLSGGMQQKLFLAISLAKTCLLRVICDPLRGLDKTTRGTVPDLLRSVANVGPPILLYSQDADFLLKTCDQISVLRVGEAPLSVFPQELTAAADLARYL